MQPDFAQAVIVAGLDLRLQFEVHRDEGVVLRIGDMDLRRQIMRDGEGAFAIALRRQRRRRPQCRTAAGPIRRR